MELPENQELIDTLILEGALVISGIDDNGEILYRVTDRMKDLAPELYAEFMNMIQQSVMSLWEQGFINMDVTKINPLVSPTEKALDKQSITKLNEADQKTLEALMMGFRGDL